VGLWVIGTYKLAKAFVFLGAGVLLIYLARTGAEHGLEHLGGWARLDVQSWVGRAAARLDTIDRRTLQAIGAATMLYSLLYFAQSVGLLLRRRWGAYLVIVNAGFLVPFECYEVFLRVTWIRIGALALNLAIVAYLVEKLRQDQRRQAAGFRRPGRDRGNGKPARPGPFTGLPAQPC
jgi:uncharacterized membrane protein (DUF2068 family)